MRVQFRNLLAWFLTISAVISADCPKHCRCDNQRMECTGEIPDWIPPGVRSVIVYAAIIHETMNFGGRGWNNVTNLSINPGSSVNKTAKDIIVPLEDDTFVRLENLEQLQVACLCLREVKENAFRGLHNLKVLDLSNNILTPESFTIGLAGNFANLPDLEELYLARTSVFQPPDFTIDSDFLHALANISLKVLDLSDTKHRFDPRVGFYLFEALRDLKLLNMSKSEAAVSSYVAIMLNYNALFPGFQNMQALDISYHNKLKFLQYRAKGSLSELNIFATTLTEIYLRNVFGVPFKLHFKSQTVDSSGVCFSIQIEEAGHFEWCFIGQLNVEKFDFAENLLMYVDPKFVKYLAATLRYVDLSKNILGDEFSKVDYIQSLIFHMNRLEVLIVAGNAIFAIPEYAFKDGTNIRILDLSDNKLEAITFETKYLVSLRKLYLSNNKIKTIDDVSLARLYHLKSTANKNDTVEYGETQICLEGNPLACSCENQKYLLWIWAQSETAGCFLHEEIPIYENGLRYADFDCQKTIVMAVFSVLAFLELSIVTLLVFIVVREKMIALKRKKIISGIKQYRRSLKKRTSPPVFLSFCSEDDDIVMEEIAPKLDEGLKRLLNTDEKCVATGYSDFRPGLSLATEIIRCIEGSSVVVFFVTNAFCKKEWCRNEALVAHYVNKPMILMIWEELDLKTLPKYMYYHYQENVRVHWIQENGRRVMKPGWDKLCEAIIKSFAETGK